MANKYLDYSGLQELVTKIKTLITSEVNTKTSGSIKAITYSAGNISITSKAGAGYLEMNIPSGTIPSGYTPISLYVLGWNNSGAGAFNAVLYNPSDGSGYILITSQTTGLITNVRFKIICVKTELIA